MTVYDLLPVDGYTIDLRAPGPGPRYGVEIRFPSGLVAAELDSDGAYRIFFPPHMMRIRLRADPVAAVVARAERALREAGLAAEVTAPEPLVDRGRPAYDPGARWLRSWQIIIEVFALRLHGRKRRQACLQVARWHGLEYTTVNQMIPRTSGYKNLGRINHILQGSGRP